MEEQLTALNLKLDSLTTQVEYLTEQAELAARRRADRAELMDDLTPIVNDVFRLTTEQLEEVQSYVDLGDLLRLLKRLLRNGPTFERMLDQLESLMDLANTVGPITDSVFEKAADLLQRAECKGYFTFAERGTRLVDGVVTSFNEFNPPEDTSLRSLLRRMRDPDVRRGWALMMHVLGTVGSQSRALKSGLPGRRVMAKPCAEEQRPTA